MVTVLGAEERVRIVGWAEAAISAGAWSPMAGAAPVPSTYDPESGMWEVAVEIGASGWTKVHVAVVAS